MYSSAVSELSFMYLPTGTELIWLGGVGSAGAVVSVGGVGSVGHYWSSTQANKGIAYNLDYFYNGSSQVKSENMTSGLSVRCVVEL